MSYRKPDFVDIAGTMFIFCRVIKNKNKIFFIKYMEIYIM